MCPPAFRAPRSHETLRMADGHEVVEATRAMRRAFKVRTLAACRTAATLRRQLGRAAPIAAAISSLDWGAMAQVSWLFIWLGGSGASRLHSRRLAPQAGVVLGWSLDWLSAISRDLPPPTQ